MLSLVQAGVLEVHVRGSRPDRLDPDWARANIERVWRAQVKKKTLKAWDGR